MPSLAAGQAGGAGADAVGAGAGVRVCGCAGVRVCGCGRGCAWVRVRRASSGAVCGNRPESARPLPPRGLKPRARPTESSIDFMLPSRRRTHCFDKFSEFFKSEC